MSTGTRVFICCSVQYRVALCSIQPFSSHTGWFIWYEGELGNLANSLHLLYPDILHRPWPWPPGRQSLVFAPLDLITFLPCQMSYVLSHTCFVPCQKYFTLGRIKAMHSLICDACRLAIASTILVSIPISRRRLCNLDGRRALSSSHARSVQVFRGFADCYTS